MITDKVIDDRSLASTLTAKNTILDFLSQETRSLLQTTLGTKLDETFDNLQSLQTIWNKVLVDAIHFLRLNDARERAFLATLGNRDELSNWEDANKTTWSTDGAAENAPYNVYGFAELFAYFQQFTEFEATLYGADKRYRDHVQHPLRVWLIGLDILSQFAPIFSFRVGDDLQVMTAPHAQPSWYKPSDGAKKPTVSHGLVDRLQISTNEIAAMWTAVALTHDLGYPLEKVERINDQLERMLSKFGRINFSRSRFSFEVQHDHLVRFLLRMISSSIKKIPEMERVDTDRCWHTHLREKYHTKFAKSWEAFSHGIVSSLILLKSLTFFLESDYARDHYVPLGNEDARQYAIRAEILHAVAAHTAPAIYHLAANNLPFLLVLCDELQEYGRPTLADLRHGTKTGNAIKVTIEKCDIRSDSSVIHCCVDYEVCSWKEQREHARHVFRAWHERLRLAVDDTKRRMDFKWALRFGDKAMPWEFHLDSSKPIFRQIRAQRPTKDNTMIREDFCFLNDPEPETART